MISFIIFHIHWCMGTETNKQTIINQYLYETLYDFFFKKKKKKKKEINK